MPDWALPAVVAHADWSKEAGKRWMACATLHDGVYTARAPEQAKDAGGLLLQLEQEVGERGPVLMGFDFPIGLPAAYASRAGISDYMAWLPLMGSGEWAEFDKVACTREQIWLRRPFYPHASGGKRLQHLLDGLGLSERGDLLRMCEHAHALAGAASPLFWTMGAKQVGKAALSGWREVLVPALHRDAAYVAIWPFAGDLATLLGQYPVVIVETYPGEMYHHLGVTWPFLGHGVPSGKRSQQARKRNACALLEIADARSIELTCDLKDCVENGFGPSKDGEDPFDAVVGLLGMLNILLGGRALAEPVDARTRHVEGWIFGRPAG